MKGTALAWAAGPFGNIATVELLLKAGANANASDNNGMTPIIWAARYGDAERVEALVAAGADPAVKDGAGKDAADYAMARSDTAGKAIVEVLSPKS